MASLGSLGYAAVRLGRGAVGGGLYQGFAAVYCCVEERGRGSSSCPGSSRVGGNPRGSHVLGLAAGFTAFIFLINMGFCGTSLSILAGGVRCGEVLLMGVLYMEGLVFTGCTVRSQVVVLRMLEILFGGIWGGGFPSCSLDA